VAQRGERSTIVALFAAKIEATRRYLPPAQVAAAVRALQQERRAHMRALAERKQAAITAGRERRVAERLSDKQQDRARQQAKPS
jgi:hypothetical protein